MQLCTTSADLPDDPAVRNLLSTCDEGITALQDEVTRLISLHHKHEFSPSTDEIDGYINELHQMEHESEELCTDLTDYLSIDESNCRLIQDTLRFSFFAYLKHKNEKELQLDYFLIFSMNMEVLQTTYLKDFEIRGIYSILGSSPHSGYVNISVCNICPISKCGEGA